MHIRFFRPVGRRSILTHLLAFRLIFIGKRVLAPRHWTERASMHTTRWLVIQCRITEPRPLLSETLEYILIPKGGKRFEVTAYELKFIQDQWLWMILKIGLGWSLKGRFSRDLNVTLRRLRIWILNPESYKTQDLSHNLSNPGIDRIFKITIDSRLYWITSYYYWRATRLRQVIADGDRNLERLGPLVTTKGGIFTRKTVNF